MDPSKTAQRTPTYQPRLAVFSAIGALWVFVLVALGAFTVPGDGSLDFGAIVQRLADHGYEGWFVVEAEQDPKVSPPLEMARKGHKELLRVMAAAGYEVVQ